jgi:hypothetical protein
VTATERPKAETQQRARTNLFMLMIILLLVEDSECSEPDLSRPLLPSNNFRNTTSPKKRLSMLPYP